MSWKMRKEGTVAYFKVLSRHLPRRTKENHENFNQDIPCPPRDSNRVRCSSLGTFTFNANVDPLVFI
jgi:hypothetical protein